MESYHKGFGQTLEPCSKHKQQILTVYVHRGQIREANDCCRRAIEYATGITPDQCKRITRNTGWTPKGMSITNAIASLWEAANKKPNIKADVDIGEIEKKTGIVFVDGGKHVVGVKNGVPEELIVGAIAVAAWI